jgi:hypothetical protein
MSIPAFFRAETAERQQLLLLLGHCLEKKRERERETERKRETERERERNRERERKRKREREREISSIVGNE